MDNQKVILITGCSSGFGLLTAVRLASRGHFVWATMRDLSKTKELQEALAENNTQAYIRQLDVTSPQSIKNVVDEINQRHSHIDVVINNAGFGIAGFFEDLTQDEIRSVMETNFFGVQNVCREVIPLMRKHKHGKIINISSIAGRVATPCLGAYNASKWALEAFSESLYHELGLFGIQVVVVEPGSYPTKIFTKNEHYCASFENKQSPYFHFSQRLKEIAAEKLNNLKTNPDHVAKLVEKIIDDPHPKLRYISDFSSASRVWAQNTLPPSFLTKIFRRLIHANE